MKAIAVLLLIEMLICSSAHAAARTLLQETLQIEPALTATALSNATDVEAIAPTDTVLYPAELQVPKKCNLMYRCLGAGNHTQFCTTKGQWKGIGVNVTLACDGDIQGSLKYSADIPVYTLPCGSIQGNETTDIQFLSSTKALTDSPEYRRSTVKGSGKGCLADVTYIIRSNITGGVPANKTCTTFGSTIPLFYNGTYSFIHCDE